MYMQDNNNSNNNNNNTNNGGVFHNYACLRVAAFTYIYSAKLRWFSLHFFFLAGMMGAVKVAFPDWESKVHSVTMITDGTATVITQQCCGKMKADMVAMGPFPAVALADAPAEAKSTNCTLPCQVGIYTFSADGTKVRKVPLDVVNNTVQCTIL